MKHVDEYRDPHKVRKLQRQLEGAVTRPWTLMEVCGGQTHTIVRHGLDQLLPQGITLIHGPGCPVCVTPVEQLDRAMELAARPEIIFCSFGDMLRVPGTQTDLLTVKARGGDVRAVYSPLDAVHIAADHPHKQIVFFAVGFETTAPAVALAVVRARSLGLQNFSLLISHVLVPPALRSILTSPDCRVDGFLAAGHVCTITGTTAYLPIAKRYGVPIVVTGFEPTDILQGVLLCVRQLEQGRAEVENQYARVVRPEGNSHAQALIERVFTVSPRTWRGLGEIPQSGFTLSPAYADFDAERRFELDSGVTEEASECIAGKVLQGTRSPLNCSAFATRCTPQHPLGAPMVSSEGACAAYYRYRRRPVAPSQDAKASRETKEKTV